MLAEKLQKYIKRRVQVEEMEQNKGAKIRGINENILSYRELWLARFRFDGGITIGEDIASLSVLWIQVR